MDSLRGQPMNTKEHGKSMARCRKRAAIAGRYASKYTNDLQQHVPTVLLMLSTCFTTAACNAITLQLKLLEMKASRLCRKLTIAQVAMTRSMLYLDLEHV